MKTLLANLGRTASTVILASVAAHAAPDSLKEAYKGHFYVGVAINRTIAAEAGGTADNVNRNEAQAKKDAALVLEQYNQISPENDLKWALIHPREGKDGYNFGPADAYVAFGERHNLYLVGHTLVWHGQTPTWVFQGNNPPPPSAEGSNPGGGRGRYTGPRASREELLERMRDHIHTVVGRYKGKIKVWDVVNEAIADGGTDVLRKSLWLEIIGPDFIAKAFEYAHEADPDAILRYNDYGLESATKRQKLITLVKSLLEQKVPVMAIGTQAHVNVSSPTFEQMDQTLTELESLGLPIHVTELDVNSARAGQQGTQADVAANAATTAGGLVSEADTRLADQYANLFRAFLKHDKAVKVVTMWGVNDAVSWRAAGRPLLFDGNDAPKPAFHAVIKVAAEGK